MARVNGREFSTGELRDIFRTLDTGGDRPAVRQRVRSLQGRGVSNDTIRGLRELHRQVRRSQGYNVKVGGVRNLRDDERAAETAGPAARQKAHSAVQEARSATN